MFYKKTNIKIYGCCYKVPYNKITLCHYVLTEIKIKKTFFGYKIKCKLYFNVYSSNNYDENFINFDKRENILKNNKLFFNEICFKKTLNEKIKKISIKEIKELVYRTHFNSMVFLNKCNIENINLGMEDKRKKI